MAQHDDWLERLEDMLVARRAEVDRVGDTLNVKVGRSMTAARANIDPAGLFDVLEDAASTEHRRLIAGFASGVHQVLLEPKRSKASEWSYEQAAGRLLPNVEVHTFGLGAEAAGGAPFTDEFHEDLVLGYFIELDMGVRVFTQAQFDRWSASAGRVSAAARSMLFHKSRDARPAAVDGFDGVEVIHLGDSYDAMRSIVVADLFFAEFDDSFRFSMPSQDALLFVRGHDDAQLAALRAATDQQFEAADYPLSRSLYAFETGKPALDESRN